jgi:hypothetical protein
MKKFILFTTLCFCFSLFPAGASANSSGLVIDEFRTRSVAIYDDEYIIVANYSSSAINLEKYSLKKLTTTLRATVIITFPSYSLSPKTKIRVAAAGVGDFKYSGSILADTNNAIVLYNKDSTPIDAVTYGSVNDFVGKEGALLNPEKAVPYRRINGQDTNNNPADFRPVLPEVKTDPNLNKIILTEMLPNPASTDEWFEIYNTSTQSINLSGISVCDVAGSTTCFNLPAESISPHGFKAFNKTKTKITLNDDKDGLVLKLSSGVIFNRSGVFTKAKNGISYALFADGWKWTGTPTKGAKNVLKQAAATSQSTSKTTRKSFATTDDQETATESEGQYTEKDTSDENNPDSQVLGSQDAGENRKISNKEIGYFVIVLALCIIIGYTIIENKERIYDFYHKFTSRNAKRGG